MLRQRHNMPRGGATLLEAAITLLVFLILVLGAIDLGIAIFRTTVLSQAARQGARQAIVHGNLAKPGWKGGPWGPATYGPVAATDSDPKAQAVAPYLGGMDPGDVQVTYTWIDGSNLTEKRVRVTVTTTWSPLTLFIFGHLSLDLRGSSTMPIAH